MADIVDNAAGLEEYLTGPAMIIMLICVVLQALRVPGVR